MERTSFVKRKASSIGSRFSSAVSDGSANHDTIGIALSKEKSGWLLNFVKQNRKTNVRIE